MLSQFVRGIVLCSGFLTLVSPSLLFAAEDWQDITTTRLPPIPQPSRSSAPAPVISGQAATATDNSKGTPSADDGPVALPSGEVAAGKVDAETGELLTDVTNADAYLPGNGQITGAFGIEFDQPLDPQLMQGSLDWQATPPLPAGQVYKRTIGPFTMPVTRVKPTELPLLLAKAKHRYRGFVDFDNRPVWIVADISRDMSEIVTILTRKYGEPTLLEGDQRQFTDGSNFIRVTQVDEAGSLEYINVEGLADYLKIRNTPVRDKFTATPRPGLAPDEAQILALADQLAVIGRQEDPVFGLPFGRRVNFRATPGEAVPFNPPRPLQGLGDGVYSIVVSPKLLPMVASLTLKGSAVYLAEQKKLVDDALLLVFGRFLKHSSNHSVISVQGLTISALQRGGVLTLSVHDAAESRRVHDAERVLAHRDAEQAKVDRKAQAARDAQVQAEAEAEADRLAELEVQRQALEARRAEQGF